MVRVIDERYWGRFAGRVVVKTRTVGGGVATALEDVMTKDELADTNLEDMLADELVRDSNGVAVELLDVPEDVVDTELCTPDLDDVGDVLDPRVSDAGEVLAAKLSALMISAA